MGNAIPLIAAASLSLALGSCTFIDYNTAPVGRFSGAALVVWTGAGDQSILGDGEFLYVPYPGRELVFHRASNSGASPGNGTIAPEPFYTDGGSVPRFVQGLPGFNAWAFGPAYIVHDWVFVVRRCINDDNDAYKDHPVKNMTFRESAELMAESIKTTIVQYDISDTAGQAGGVIAPVTAGPVTRDLWEAKGACKAGVRDEHQEIVDDIRGKTARGIAPSIDPGILGTTNVTRSGTSYVVVGTYALD